MPTKAKANGEKVISDRTWLSEQSWYRERIVEQGADRLRFLLRRNAYVFQSHAEVQVWRAEGWRTVHRLAGEQMGTRASYDRRPVQPTAFDADLAELRRVACTVLGGKGK